jgi:hypothetical protein
MAKLGAFKPVGEATLTIALTNGAAVATKLALLGESLLIYNPTNGIVFAAIGPANSVVASPSADYPIPPGARAIIDLGPMQSGALSPGGVPPAKYLSLYLASGATNGSVYVTPGDGSIY